MTSSTVLSCSRSNLRLSFRPQPRAGRPCLWRSAGGRRRGRHLDSMCQSINADVSDSDQAFSMAMDPSLTDSMDLPRTPTRKRQCGHALVVSICPVRCFPSHAHVVATDGRRGCPRRGAVESEAKRRSPRRRQRNKGSFPLLDLSLGHSPFPSSCFSLAPAHLNHPAAGETHPLRTPAPGD